jgi:peptidoglycan hydrolase CwlO-like protein
MVLKTPKLQFNHLKVGMVALLLIASYSLAVPATLSAEPSASTQKFFGFSSGGGNGALPASCDVKRLLDENQDLLNQITTLQNQTDAKIKALDAQVANLPPGSDDDHSQENAVKQQETDIRNDTQQQMAAIKARQEVIHKATQGPSDECKADLVRQTVANLQQTVAAINGGQFSATLAKVDSVSAEIQDMLPTLSKSGVNNKDIATVKKQLATVKASSATLKGYFSAMGAQATSFIAAAQANPVGTYDKLQSGGGPLNGSLTNGASSAADNLVNSFTSLVNLFDKLTGTTGGQ